MESIAHIQVIIKLLYSDSTVSQMILLIVIQIVDNYAIIQGKTFGAI